MLDLQSTGAESSPEGDAWTSASFEWLVVVVSCALSGLAGAVGFRRHGRWWVPALLILSVGLLLASRCLEEVYELSSGAAFVALLGGIGMAAGHAANQRCRVGHEQGGAE